MLHFMQSGRKNKKKICEAVRAYWQRLHSGNPTMEPLLSRVHFISLLMQYLPVQLLEGKRTVIFQNYRF